MLKLRSGQDSNLRWDYSVWLTARTVRHSGHRNINLRNLRKVFILSNFSAWYRSRTDHLPRCNFSAHCRFGGIYRLRSGDVWLTARQFPISLIPQISVFDNLFYELVRRTDKLRVVLPLGLQPRTPDLRDRYSSQLSYESKFVELREYDSPFTDCKTVVLANYHYSPIINSHG